MNHEENHRVKQQYDRIAGSYDLVDRLIPRSWRIKTTRLAYGRVLEAGVGTGLNLPYYTDRCQELVAIDLSPSMLAQAARRITQCKASVVLAEMDIQELDQPIIVPGVLPRFWKAHWDSLLLKSQSKKLCTQLERVANLLLKRMASSA